MRYNQPITQGWSRIAIFFAGNKQLSIGKKSQFTPYLRASITCFGWQSLHIHTSKVHAQHVGFFIQHSLHCLTLTHFKIACTQTMLINFLTQNKSGPEVPLLDESASKSPHLHSSTNPFKIQMSEFNMMYLPVAKYDLSICNNRPVILPRFSTQLRVQQLLLTILTFHKLDGKKYFTKRTTRSVIHVPK